jgi:hypothetical protein
LKVVGDSLGYHRRFKIKGDKLYRCRIGVQTGSAVVTIIGMSELVWWKLVEYHRRSGIRSKGDDGGINVGLAYDPALM